jgi:hypothetical protein
VDLFMAISQGVGVSLATGVRALLPPLAVGVFARADAGVDFNGTGYGFLESVPWLAVLVALVAVAMGGRHQRLAFAAAMITAACFFAGSGRKRARTGFLPRRGFFGVTFVCARKT